MKRSAALLLALLLTAPAFAWGEKGHLLTNEAATLTLPNDLPTFFYKAFPDLVYLAPEPDRWRSGGESLDAVNAPDHFLDYEYVRGLELPRDRYVFIALLGRSGTLRRHGIGNSTPGFLPWRIAEMHEQLIAQFRLWRASAPGSREREYIEHNIVQTAGVLSHFVADASNPLHTTYNFNGWVDPNPHGYAYDCATHARFESDFVNRAIEKSDVVPLVAAPVLRPDAFAAAIELIKESNALVEPLYAMDRDHDVVRLKAFAAARLAAGASMLRDLWWSAWRASEGTRQRRR
jgi:hypothetical protein